MLFFQLTAWVIPVLIAATAYGEKAVGNSEDLVSSGWCWIKIDRNGDRWWNVLWMCIAGKGWEILSYIAISVFYFLVKWQIRREVSCIIRINFILVSAVCTVVLIGDTVQKSNQIIGLVLTLSLPPK